MCDVSPPAEGKGRLVSTFNKGLERVEVELSWDPSPVGMPDDDLDLIAATYSADRPYEEPAYLVHFDSRAPDGTITLHRDSRTGQGFGADEAMTVELDRLADRYVRVVLGVVIQPTDGRKTFGAVANTSVLVKEGYTTLVEDDFADVSGATAATVAEFRRDTGGAWRCARLLRGYDADPERFTQLMGRREPS